MQHTDTLPSPNVISLPIARSRDGQRWLILIIALLTLGSGLLNIYSVIGPSLKVRVELLRHFLPLEIVQYSRSVVLFTGIALVVSSYNILRRKRRAWKLAMCLTLAAVVLHLTKGIDYAEASLSIVLALALWVVRDRFTVRSRELDPRSAGLRAGVVALLALSYGVAGFWLLEPREFGINFNWLQSLRYTISILTFNGADELVPYTRHAHWFLQSLQLITFGTAGYVAWALFRPVIYRFRTHPAEMEEARRIVESFGRTALDFFKFSADKSFFFSPDRKAFLAYRVGANFAVVLGDPVGPHDKAGALIRSFLEYCRDNGWSVAFHQASSEFLPLYHQAGLRRLKVGDDAIVRLDDMLLDGKSGKHLRSKLNQLEKAGYTARLYEAPVPEEVLDKAEEVSEEWLQLPGRRERQFTLGKFDRYYLRHTDLLAVEEPDGRMLAFVNFIPSYRPKEATLDLMRRRAQSPNGTMDYLFLKAFLVARDRGCERFSLGMAPMSGFQPGEESSPEQRAIHAFIQRLNFIFSFQGLRAYKAKFASQWEPIYVIYQSALDLPLLPIALGRVSELPKEE